MSVWDFTKNSVMWNSTAFLAQVDEEMKKKDKQGKYKDTPLGTWVTLGNITEQALINFFKEDMGPEAVNAHKEALESQKECVIQFSSLRKRASVVVKTETGYRVYCKGAPDILMPNTNWIVLNGGNVQPIHEDSPVDKSLWKPGEVDPNDTGLGILDRTIDKFANEAFRTILMTYRDLSESEYNDLKAQNNDFAKEEDREVLEDDLTAVGIWGIQDPLREGIEQAIIECKIAGIQVIMCTGDNLQTAIAISKRAGICNEEDATNPYACTTGKAFRAKVGETLQEVVDEKTGKTTEHLRNRKEFGNYHKQLRVLARSSPMDKRILVTGMQAYQGVVAVTGDGTNDAPALRKADVGFSMGITGTQVAQSASDIILLDDNFSSIVVALRYGRNVYDSVRKFLQFQLAVNVTAMAIVFFGSCILSDSPLNAVQMLWVNLVMDTFGALALATEPPMADILKRPPYAKSAPIVSDVMWRNIFGHAIYQILVLALVIFLVPGNMTENYWQACTTPGVKVSMCNNWNPFYTNYLYETD